jgi:hypothetical protein
MLQIIFMTFINSWKFCGKTAMAFPHSHSPPAGKSLLRLTKFVFIALNINLIETLE